MGGKDPLPGFEDHAPVDRYCDLILTGGVTSAVAYPTAALVLASAYRFHAIGGASSGAGIAAAVAAAEYARRRGSGQGYSRMLEQVNAIADERGGRANLSRLFQPTKGLHRLFRSVLRFAALPEHKVSHLAADAVCAYGLWILLGAALALAFVAGVSALWKEQGLIAYALAALFGATLALAAALWCDLQRLLAADYGLCDGQSRQAGEDHPPLTDWLHRLIQNAACRGDGEAPVSFADLHGAPGSPQQTLGEPGELSRQSIRLQMMAANVTLGEPVRFPREPEDTPLYFRAGEMRKLFPKQVVDHMLAHATPYAGPAAPVEPGAPPPAGWTADDRRFYSLPRLELPLIVAARMSVSFPVLFSAVPLWREDPTTKPLRLRRCLFLDGGLCSNFPIHLFDSLLPPWPTFGIHLRDLDGGPVHPQDPKDPCPPVRVELPRDDDGRFPHFEDFDERAKPLGRLFGLAGAALATIKDWTDNTQARLPGVRDRIVTLSLPPGVGGLNLLMSGQEIRCLAERGVDAARKLLARFSQPSAATGQARGWDAHRLMRFRLAYESLLQAVSGLTQSAAAPRHATAMRELFRRARDDEPAPTASSDPNQAFALPLRADQVATLEGALAALQRLETDLANGELALPKAPHPTPELRVRPPL